jgi:FG-GAP-like repeat
MSRTDSRARSRLLDLPFLAALWLLGCGDTTAAPGAMSSAGNASGGAVTTVSAGNAAGGSSPGGAGMPAVAGDAALGGSAPLAGNTSTGGGAGSANAGAGGIKASDCSESPLRTQAPAGKEAFDYEPQDQKFPFSGHWVGVFSDDPRYIGATTLGDFDHDGDLDFADGQREDVGGGAAWWEYCAPDHWVRHQMGSGHKYWSGGNAADFDGDGWADVIVGDSWYRNPKTPRSAAWDRFPTGGPKPEEIILGDVTGDKKPEALYLHNNFQPQFWSPGADPTKQWTLGPLLEHNQQQGGAIGDFDGDGDNDILAGYRWWYRNVNGDGTNWETVEIFASGFDDSPLTYQGDFDADGDLDFAMVTHFGGRVAWASNDDGKGLQFSLHMLATDKNFLHTIVAADFDNDGDLDLLVGNNVGKSFIYDNTDGKGSFVEHLIAADTRSHEARVGDVDCDGDLDIVGAPWGDQNEGGEQSKPLRDHVYLKNELVERGGKPLFERKEFELGLTANCKKP